MLKCIFGKCSSETYVVNKPSEIRSKNKLSIIGTHIQPSTENEQPTAGTQNFNNNRQTNIGNNVTDLKIKQNGQTPVIADVPNHIQTSQTTKKVQTSTTTETVGTSIIQTPQKVQETQTSTAAEPAPAQAPQKVQETQTPPPVEATPSQAPQKTQEVQTPTPVETTPVLSSRKPQEIRTPTPIEETPAQAPQKTQEIQTSTTTDETIQTSEIKKSESKSVRKEAPSKSKSPAPPPPRPTSDDGDSSKRAVQGASSSAENGVDDSESEGEGKNIKITVDGDETGKGKGAKPKKNGDGDEVATLRKRRSGVVPLPVTYDEEAQSKLPSYPKSPEDEAEIRDAIERNDFLNKIISGQRLNDVVNAMYSKEIPAKETIIKQGEKGSHMYISSKGKFQILIKNKAVSEFSDVRVFGELAILYNAKRLATIKALTKCRVWVLDRHVYQQISVGYNIRKQDEIMQFLMNNEKLKVVGKEALQEVTNLLKSEFFKSGTQIVRQGDKGNKFYIIRAGTVTITKEGEGEVGVYKKGDCFGELALLKEDCRQATVTANAPGVECLTLTRKEFVDHFGELKEWEYINVRPQDSFKDGVTEHEDIDLRDLKIIKTLGVGGFGRVELVQHKKKSDLVFALKYLKKIDIVMQHQQEHVYNEKNIQMACKSPFIVRLYRTYKDNKYIYLLMESCLGGDLWSLLQKQKLRRFEEKEARFIAACVLESFEYLHTRGIIYRDLKPENLLIAGNGYIKLTDFGFAKKISSRGKTFTFAGTPEYVAPEIVLNRGHDRSVDYWAFGAFIFELLTGRTPFRTDDSSHMKTYNKILSGIDNVQFPSYVNLKARHIVEKLCRPVPSERLGMQKRGIKDIKEHKWFLGFEWQRFAKCEVPSPFKPKLKSQIDTQYFDQFKKDTDVPPDELSGWDTQF